MKNRISERADEWGLHLIMLLGALALFVYLWGIRLPSLTAGMALYVFFVILRKRGKLQRTLRKEKGLRRKLGGEMALERMLLQDAHKNHVELAQLLVKKSSHRYLSASENGIYYCPSQNQHILIRYLPLHPGDTLQGGDVAAVQRMCLKYQGNHVWLCVPGKISAQAIEQSAMYPFVRLIDREELIALLGSAHPATDRDLVNLHRRTHKARQRHEWMKELLRIENAPRFARFAALMAALLFLTGQQIYAFSATWMMALAALCKCMHTRTKKASPVRDA